MEKGNYLIHLPQTTEKNRFCSPDVPAYRWRLRSRPETTGTSVANVMCASARGEKIYTGYKWIVGKGMPCRVSTAEQKLLATSTSRKPKGFSRLSIPNSRHNVQPDDAWTCLDGPLGFRKTSVRS